jgi:RHS repeat-associated protein
MDTIFYPWGQPAVAGSGVEALWAGFDDGNGWLLHEWQTVTRRYSQGVSRWFTPDPLGGDVTNPQSLNLYAYVLNNPTSLIDPLGLDPCTSANTGPGGSYACSPQHASQSNTSGGGGGGDLSYTLDGSPLTSWESSGLFSSGAVCIGSCSQPVLTTTSGAVISVVQVAGGQIYVSSNGDVFDNASELGLPSLDGGGDDSGNDFSGGATGGLPCNPGFIKASNQAWMRASNGQTAAEAGFWTKGSVQNPTFINLPYTNQPLTITGLQVPTGAIALTHTHPNNSVAAPSPGDMHNSNASGLPFYVLSSRGMYVFNPGTKASVLLRPNISWQKPCR